MSRTHYHNGDPIHLDCGCNGCTPVRVNGLLCHELGCPDSWRDHEEECRECGSDFVKSDRHQTLCDDCLSDPPDMPSWVDD